MTAHDPRVTLTEAELTYGRTYPNIGDRGRWYSEGSVREIIAARLAPIRALADEWDNEPNLPPSTYNLVDDLRAALHAPASASQDHDGAEGQGEGDLCAAECGKRVDRTIPNPIPEGFELMWSESMTGRALYCQACFDKPDPEES